MKGKIARYFSFRGFGFIEVEDREKDIFFHMSNFPPRILPIIGLTVEFKLNHTPKGLEAIKINTPAQESGEKKTGQTSDLEK